MDDTKICPICKNKFNSKSINNSKFERTCSGINHTLTIISSSKQIESIKFSLDSKYSKFIEIDFLNNLSTITCYDNKKESKIKIPKILTPDFPKLTSLKQNVQMYISIS